VRGKFLVDFDGTAMMEDVGHQILVKFGDEEVIEIDDRWVAGEITTRERAEAQYARMKITEDELVEFVDGFALDPFFGEFRRYCRAAEIELEIVSDGFDFYIKRLLGRAGLRDIPVTCNRLEFVDGKIVLDFPHEGEGDGRLGVAKDVLLKRAKEGFDEVAYAGDADSDKPAAGVADVLFAKKKKALAKHCEKEGIECVPYSNFGEIIAALTGMWNRVERRAPADGSFYELARGFDRIEGVSGRIAMTAILAELLRNAESEDGRRIAYLLQGRVAPTFEPVEFGVGARMLVTAIAAAFGVGGEEVERRFKEMGDHGLVAESFADKTAGSRSIAEVFAALETIAATSGKNSVEGKIEQVTDLMRSFGSLENRYFARIPIERLRLGVGDPTILDALSFAGVGDKSDRAEIERAYNMVSDLGMVAERYLRDGVGGLAAIKVEVGNPVRMAQAARLSSGAEIVEKIGRCGIEPKYDGFRVQIHRDGDEVRIYSRNLEDMTGMFPEVAEATRTQLSEDRVILEGEAMAYDPDTRDFLPFQVTVSRRRKHNIEEMAAKAPLTLLAFDLLCASGEDLTGLSYVERRERLLKLVEPNEAIAVTPSLITDDPKEIETYFSEEVEAGLEGILAKRLDAVYQAGKRNFNWIKLKRSYKVELSDTLDCAIVGYWRGQGKRAAWGIGALLTAVWDETEGRLKTIARVGTGLSDLEWVEMRELLDRDVRDGAPAELDSGIEPDVWVDPRHVVEVLADELTRSPNHTAGRNEDKPGYALRFPRVLGMPRADKWPNDATTVAEVEAMFTAQVTGSAKRG